MMAMANSHTRLYSIWKGMKTRCYSQNHHTYKYYGARGIKVCDEWRNSFLIFKDWADKTGYTDSLSIDRIDTNGDYEPTNCKWSSFVEQNNNTRRNHKIYAFGGLYTIAEIAKKTGMKQNTLLYRLKRGWTVERAVTEGIRR